MPFLRRSTTALLLLLCILGVSEWGLPAVGVPPYILPLPSQVLRTLFVARADLMGHLAATALAATLGLGVGAFGGVILAIAFVIVRPLEEALYPWVIFSQAIPVAALAPLLTIWLGDGLAPRVALAALFAFFPVLVGALQGLRGVAPEELALMRVWGARSWAVLRYLRWPTALPMLFAGLRIAATLAVVGVIVSELAGSGRGLGFVISVATYRLRMDRVFAAVLLAALLNLVIHALLRVAEWRILFWYRPREG